MRRIVLLSVAFILTLFLAACDTAEERAEEHYQSALTLLSEGDIDRAIVELRNVFRLVPNHKEARYEIARAHMVKGNPERAYSQFLRLVEQYPEELEARIELSEIAFHSASWDELLRHGTIARDLDPENGRVKVISLAIEYREALEAEDSSARARHVATAEGLLVGEPENRFLLELVLDNFLREWDLGSALSLLDNLTAEYPEEQKFWLQRLQVLLALDDQDEIEKQLVDLVARYPEDAERKQMLVRYYLSRDELDKTEAFLRQLVESTNEPGARVDLIRFLMELRSIDAARVELTAAIEEVEDPAQFIILKTGLDFRTGNVDIAIQELEAAIANSEGAPLVNDMKVALARMLLETENEVGARSLVEEVLTEDPDHVAALKMSAAWMIEADDTDGAIAALRSALDSSSEDSETLTLMADAYLRAGSSDLARDFLSLAVETSGNSPSETVRYAQLLISEERYLPAEDVLLPALRLAPNDVTLLQTAGQLYVAKEDNGRLRQVISTLNGLETAVATQLAVQFEAEFLNRTAGSDRALEFLEEVAGAANSNLQSRVLLLRGHIVTEDFEAAISLAEDIVADSPERAETRAILAATLAASGDLLGSKDIYTSLAEEFPDESNYRVDVASIQSRLGNPEEARATIQRALADAPDDARLLWANASYLESDGDFDGAIAVYDNLYQQNSNNIVVANNLASLIATYRDDDESLNRAWAIARRFHDVEIPAIQDTYGWIAHRQGNSEDALPYLEKAAASLQDDPIVLYHYAEVLFATNRHEEALVQFRAALDMAGIGDTRSQFEKSLERIAEIEAAQTGGE